jgi:hypothetical protein
MHAHPGFVIVSRALELTEARGLFRRCRGLGFGIVDAVRTGG